MHIAIQEPRGLKQILLKEFETNITRQMSEPKKHAPARPHFRRAIFGTLLAVVFLGSLIIYTQFFSPRQRLWRELAAYQTSIQRGDPRPDRVPHLTSNSVPFLLEWIETKEIPITFSQSLGRTVSRVSPSLGAKLASLDSSPPLHPPILALLGFDFLGSQASAALPALSELALRSDAYGEATMAIIAIGPKALPIAIEFAQHPQPRIRRTAAHLLGALRSNPAESSAILLKLIDDPDLGVRSEAYHALAEFPSLNSESTLIPGLDSDSRSQFYAVAYALHSGSTNALIHLLSIARDSPNPYFRITALGALAFRDRVSKIPTGSETKGLLYQEKWVHFSQTVATVHTGFPVKSPDESHFDLIRSNILSTGLPHLEEILGPVKPPSDFAQSYNWPMNTRSNRHRP